MAPRLLRKTAIDFSGISLADAIVKDVRIYPSMTEVDFIDWQETMHTLRFNNSICCSILAAHGKTLSHGEVECDGDYLRDCCAKAEEDFHDKYRVFSFVDAWHNRKILQIIAESVVTSVS